MNFTNNFELLKSELEITYMQKPEKFTDKELERLSSAFTLSDMEIFIFPELMYSLVIANIMSPQIWEWRNEAWFKDIEKKSFNYKINRIKQYIMDHYVFNLDLDTWGLTRKDKEIARFKDFIDMDALQQSNALFGYEGDKYYFSIDIRKHFGLDKYTSDVIPYWKTETVEAMTAFRLKENYTTGAGECVSLSALYAAALFIVGKIPLEKIFLIATPLHSQNFIAEGEGLFTNNRRIVTKKMWYNGTELSDKARRAMEKEKVTIVSHISGHIHTYYPEASINLETYHTFRQSLLQFLKADFSFEVFYNYIRTRPEFWDCFQYQYEINGKTYFIDLKTIFNYEHSSKNSLVGTSRKALFDDMDARYFHLSANDDKLLLNHWERFLDANPNLEFEKKQHYFEENILKRKCTKMDDLFVGFYDFIHTEPRLPDDTHKKAIPTTYLSIDGTQSREDIIALVEKEAANNELAYLSLYTYRDMRKIDWQPYVKSAIERSPVSLEAMRGKDLNEIYRILEQMPNESVYDAFRLAQPDEVWNYQTGDGIEKAFVLANAAKNLFAHKDIQIDIRADKACVTVEKQVYHFVSLKSLEKHIEIG